MAIINQIYPAKVPQFSLFWVFNQRDLEDEVQGDATTWSFLPRERCLNLSTHEDKELHDASEIVGRGLLLLPGSKHMALKPGMLPPEWLFWARFTFMRIEV